MEDNIYKINGEFINNINIFIDKNELKGDNLKFAKLYDRIALFYSIGGKIFYKIKFGGENNFRNDFLQYINIDNNDMVLETSVGTADNFQFLNKKARYYGVDISTKMLNKALKNMRKWKINGELVCCEAENLPFNDNIFDVVYSCGGINFYNDKQKAINEMIRVAKSGTEIFIIDETEKTVREIYKNVPGKELYDAERTNMPIDLIPNGMKNIKSKIVCKGYMYIVSFEKP